MESNHPHFKLILGSSSIARRKILTDMGYQFTLMSADIDEKSIRKEKPEELVLALAETKAEAIMQRIPDGENIEEDKSTLLITCDQVVVYEDAVREKPSSVEEAREYIRGYSKGHTATVSSVAVTNLKTGVRKGGVDRVEIYFNEIPEETIEKLIEEGMVLKVAGALLIEHPLILPCVKEVVGTTDSVMGLPKELTEKLIKEVLAST
ncbi:Inosine triphosphate pyrophosphatase-like [Arabidopsis thaliana x Arabidopsis arenosa]|uniref:Inosine triphosphate pyrophosphatase-like n=1 Tax=Arabidopsis thaliana x Arabidopsis arenosa TaxID=1240361 RepID=A0A8T2CYD0_9BRAS|nr:Inosine triphosphate pyrophosphatase-like [Arabidopsis thaliana x Arabidopsis arenosa]